MSTKEIAPITKLGSALAERTQALQMEEGDVPFLRLQKGGDWVYGADDIDVQDGSQWAVNPHSFSEGFVAWGEGELLGEEMSLMTAAPILKADLPSTDASRGWVKQVGFQLKCLNGEDKGTQVLYKTSSFGGLKNSRKLISEVVTQIGVDPENIVPVIVLEQDSYKHKKYGTIYNPIFTVKSWSRLTPEAPEPVEVASAAGTEVAKAAAEVTEAPTEEVAQTDAPKKRRRPIAQA